MVCARLAGVLALFFAPHFLRADLINFEGFADGTHVTTQYAGLVFANATVATAGVSLNQFEFPPHSGLNVVFDDGGAIAINFLVPVIDFSGYFTHSVPLTLIAFDLFNNPLPTVFSIFSDNLKLSGNPGSHPNEFLDVAFAGGISRLVITGDPAGGSFALDDVAFTPAAPVPEPSSIFLLGGVMVFLLFGRGRIRLFCGASKFNSDNRGSR